MQVLSQYLLVGPIWSCIHEHEPPTGAYMAFVEPNAGDDKGENVQLLPFESIG
jgi:hypothetical protein